MGTHPIFESDFDCLTEMASGKLYTYPDNFRADKIRAVAQISGFKLQVAPEYVHGVTNKTEEFQSKFFGKVPAFESGATALCDDTAIAHFVGNQQTRGGEKTDQVICWAGFAEANLLPSVAQWVWPTLGIVAPNKNHVSQTLAFERSPDWQIDYEVYDWVKVDWDSAEAKELVTLYWKAEDGMKYDGKVLSECKIYK